ncbi:MAG: hypothetical protein WCP55_12125 [Lentisphaerota bacterium]
MKPLKIKNIEHAVVIPCGTPDRIPAAAETIVKCPSSVTSTR